MVSGRREAQDQLTDAKLMISQDEAGGGRRQAGRKEGELKLTINYQGCLPSTSAVLSQGPLKAIEHIFDYRFIPTSSVRLASLPTSPPIIITPPLRTVHFLLLVSKRFSSLVRTRY